MSRHVIDASGILILSLLAVATISEACSPAETNLYEHYTHHEFVFRGTVNNRIGDAGSGQGLYAVVVDEIFKGLPDKGIWGGTIQLVLGETEQCGIGIPKPHQPILVFSNAGDVVRTTCGSRLIWREAEQQEPFLNPTMDDLITLRRMLFPKHRTSIIPDSDSALHQALKAFIPLLGQERLTQFLPLQVTSTQSQGKPSESFWHVQGTRRCPPDETTSCVKGSITADIHPWTGDSIHIFLSSPSQNPAQ